MTATIAAMSFVIMTVIVDETKSPVMIEFKSEAECQLASDKLEKVGLVAICLEGEDKADASGD